MLEVSYNPYYFAELILTVIAGYTKRTCVLMDIYAYLPLLLYENTRTALEHTNAAGTIYRLFLKDNKKSLGGINSRLSETKKLTNEAILVALSHNWISLDETTLEIKISKKVKSRIKRKRLEERGIYDAANNLGKILSKKETHENYRLLGVNQI